LRYSNPNEVSNKVSAEWKPEKFLKFRGKINYCVFALESHLSACSKFGQPEAMLAVSFFSIIKQQTASQNFEFSNFTSIIFKKT
jgi:hypothetical protein